MKNGPYEMLIAPEGYPGKKYRGRYAYEHHVAWWRAFGFVPPKGYEIHHLNGNHRDNNIGNLQLVTGKEHRCLHGALRMAMCRVKTSCGYCKKEITIKGNNYRFKIKTNKFKKLFCSRSCGAKHQHSEVAGRS